MSFKPGDKVRIISNSNNHCFEYGDIVTLEHKYSYNFKGYEVWTETQRMGSPGNIRSNDFVLATTPGVDCVF